MFGIAATQRGRAPQPAFMMSSSSSAVVEGSTVTSFNSGAGGATAVLQSEITSAIDGDPASATMNAAPAAARRNDIIKASRLVEMIIHPGPSDLLHENMMVFYRIVRVVGTDA